MNREKAIEKIRSFINEFDRLVPFLRAGSNPEFQKVAECFYAFKEAWNEAFQKGVID